MQHASIIHPTHGEGTPRLLPWGDVELCFEVHHGLDKNWLSFKTRVVCSSGCSGVSARHVSVTATGGGRGQLASRRQCFDVESARISGGAELTTYLVGVLAPSAAPPQPCLALRAQANLFLSHPHPIPSYPVLCAGNQIPGRSGAGDLV